MSELTCSALLDVLWSLWVFSVILCPGRYDAQSVCRECVLHMYVFTEGDSNVVWACPTLTLASVSGIRFNKMLEASYGMLVYIENYQLSTYAAELLISDMVHSNQCNQFDSTASLWHAESVH